MRARAWSTVAPATAGALVLVLAGAALVREAGMPSGPGQVVLVPLVGAAFVGVALGAGVPVTTRWLLLTTGAAWLAGAWSQPAAPAGDVPFLQRLLLGDSAMLSQWAASAGQSQDAPPAEGEAEPQLEQAVTPDKIQGPEP